MSFKNYLRNHGRDDDCCKLGAMTGIEYERAIWYARRNTLSRENYTRQLIDAMNELVRAGYAPIVKCLDNYHIQVKSCRGTKFNYYASTGTIVAPGLGSHKEQSVANLLYYLERW